MDTSLKHSDSLDFFTRRSNWQPVTMLTLAFWLSSSILLIALVMPSLYVTGMMAEPGFASAGYTLFSVFNRVEVLCGALILTGVLVSRGNQDLFHRKGYVSIILAVILLGIALIDTYGLTPQMSALGLSLNLFDGKLPTPDLMNQLHASYWSLEVLKLSACGLLLNLCCRDRV